VKLVDKKILKYKRVVYYGFSRDEKILELAKEFVDKEIVLVVIVPATKEYDRPLQEAISLLDERIFVGELSLGLMANLRDKAKLYCEYNKNAELHNETK
jgi:hypothetical protein